MRPLVLGVGFALLLHQSLCLLNQALLGPLVARFNNLQEFFSFLRSLLLNLHNIYISLTNALLKIVQLRRHLLLFTFAFAESLREGRFGLLGLRDLGTDIS